jgi:methyltransferase-like protein 23
MLWESALPLSDVLSERSLRGLRVLELGAGVGLPGIVAALDGAHVMQIDLDPLALALAEHNANLNGARIARHLVDWNTWTPGQRFDLIIGADVVYDTSDHKTIVALLELALAPDGVAVLAEPSRLTTLAFLHELDLAGLPYSIETRQTSDLTRADALIDVRLIEVRARSSRVG